MGTTIRKPNALFPTFTSPLLLLLACSTNSVWDAFYERVQCAVWHADNTANMEKYRLVHEHKSEDEDFSEPSNCEIRITQQGKPRNYISYAMNMFSEGSDMIVLKAMGRAINKAVTIAEILKRKMPLHQVNSLNSVELVDVFEPLEEGLDTVMSRRYVSCMKITLSKTMEGVDLNDIGYQPPLGAKDLHPGDFHPPREAALIVSS